MGRAQGWGVGWGGGYPCSKSVIWGSPAEARVLPRWLAHISQSPGHVTHRAVPRKTVGWKVAFYVPTSEITWLSFPDSLLVREIPKAEGMDSSRYSVARFWITL